MRSTIVSIILVVFIAGIIGLLVKQPAGVSPAVTKQSPASSQPESGSTSVNPDTFDDMSSISELNRLLRQEIAARQQLETKVEELNRKLTILSSKNPEPARVEEPQTLENADTTANDANTWFNEQALVDAGMNTAEAAELRTFFEQMEMDRLFLRDQAIREGWANTPRFGEAMQQLGSKEEELKNRLDDKAYDAYLYASGQSNRVEVSSVLASSPAATAGLQAGDQVIRYDNQRIYDWRDLRQATTQGSANETVLVEVIRDGKTLQFYLPRGPLGIRMNSVSVAP